MQSPSRAILIDLDDTVLDTTASSTRLWRATVAHFAPELGRSPQSINAALDEARHRYWADPDRNARGRLDLHHARREVIRMALESLGVKPADLPARMEEHYTRRRVGVMQAFPGAIDALRRLRVAGFKLALVSNGHGPSQREKVSRFGLHRLVELVVIEGELGIGKPDPRVFQHAMDVLGAVPATTWVVGDHLQWEVAAPQAMGMRAAWLDWQGRGLPEGSTVQPDRIVRSLAEFADAHDVAPGADARR